MTVHTLHASCGGELTIQTNKFPDRIEYSAECDKCGKVYTGSIGAKWRPAASAPPTATQKKTGVEV